MLDLETRKQHTKSVIGFFKDNLYKLNPDHKINGLGVLIFHWVSIGVPLLGLFLFKLDWKFYLSASIWILICSLHFLHKGCIFTRLERELWECDDWYGPWMLPFVLLKKIGLPITSNIIDKIFLTWGFSLIIWIILRIKFSIDA